MSGRTLFSVVWDLEVFDSVMSGRTVLDLGGVGSELLLCSIALVDCRLYIANLVFRFIGESELERAKMVSTPEMSGRTCILSGRTRYA